MSLKHCGINFVFIRTREFTLLSVHFPFFYCLKQQGASLFLLESPSTVLFLPFPPKHSRSWGFSKGSEQRMNQQQIISSHLGLCTHMATKQGPHLHLSQRLQKPSPLPGLREAGASSCPRRFLGGGLGASSGSGTVRASQSPCSPGKGVSSD